MADSGLKSLPRRVAVMRIELGLQREEGGDLPAQRGSGAERVSILGKRHARSILPQGSGVFCAVS